MNLISLSEILKQSCLLYSKNFKKLFPALLGVSLVYIVETFCQIKDMSNCLIWLNLLQIIILVWLNIVFINILNRGYHQQPIILKNIYLRSWQKWFSYFLTSLLMGLIITLGFLFFIIPGFVLAVWFAFSLYYLILEDTTILGSLKASRLLVKNRWWATFIRLLIPLLAYGIICFALISLVAYAGYSLLGSSINIKGLVYLFNNLIILFSLPLFLNVHLILFNSLKQTYQIHQARTKTKGQQTTLPTNF